MTIFYSQSKRNTLLGLVVLAVAFLVFGGAQLAQATNQPVNGWGWAATAGWLSMNCDNDPANNDCASATYGVEIDDVTGELTGYGLFNPADYQSGALGYYIPNVGYISFNPVGHGGIQPAYPNGNGTVAQSASVDLVGAPSIPSRQVKGWARACAIFTSGCIESNAGAGGPPQSAANIKPTNQTGGWDGWISMSGTGYGVTLDITTGEFSGYAWGGSILGWIDFSNVTTEPLAPPVGAVDLAITADPLIVPTATANGGVNPTTTLTWSTVAATYTNCEASSPQTVSGWHGTTPTPPAVGTPQSQAGVAVTAPVTTYSIRCSEDNSVTWTDWVSVDVQQADLEFKFAGSTSCIDPATDIVSVTYETNISNFEACFASSYIAGTGGVLSTWNGTLGGSNVPTPGNPVTYDIDTAAGGLGGASNLPLTLWLECWDGDVMHPAAEPLELTVTQMCSAPLPADISISTIPSDCVPDVNNPTVDIVLESPSETEFENCRASSSPVTSDWNTSNLQPLPAVVGTTTYGGIEVVSVPQDYTIRCTDNDSGVTVQETTTLSHICGQPPIVDVTANPTAINAGQNTNISWNNQYAGSCIINTVPSSNPLNEEELASPELLTGARNNQTLNDTTYFYLTCENPYGSDQDVAIVAVDEAPGYVPPDNPCELYPDDVSCLAQRPIFEEL